MKKIKLSLVFIALSALVVSAPAAGFWKSPALSYDTFATANLTQPDNPDWGVGAGLNAMFTKHFGLGAEVIAQNTVGLAVDECSASLLGRLPIGNHFALYGFMGGGYLFEQQSWQSHQGAGLEVKITKPASLFCDGRWVTALRNERADYALIRAGIRFTF